MLLAVNIDNTRITLGGFRGSELAFTARMATGTELTCDQVAAGMKELLELYGFSPSEVDSGVVSSVVPVLTGRVSRAVQLLTEVTPLVLGPGVKTGLNILIDNPAQLGADLVAISVATAALFPMPCIVFDFGDATTVSVLGKNGAYLGAVIAAGVGINLEALSSKTALLPLVDAETPAAVIGKNTMHSIQSGLIYGTAAMADGIAVRIEQELGTSASLVATGELAQKIAAACTREVKVHENLLLEGLRRIYEKNQLK